MKRFFLLMMAGWRAWLAGLRLLMAPWRWLAALLGWSGAEPAAKPHARAEAPAPVDAEAGAAANRRTVADADADAAERKPAPGTGAEIDAEIDAKADTDSDSKTRTEADADSVEAMAQRRIDAAVVAATPAPPPTPTPLVAHALGQFIEASFRNDAGERHYKLYLPPGKPEQSLPLVVMLHGCKQNPDDFATGTRMNQLADAQPMLVLYPAQTKVANSYACWNWFGRHHQHRGEGEPSILAGIVNEVLAQHPVDPQRVYVAGLSAGGAMAATLAHTYPDLFAAAGIHSGLPFGAAQDAITALGVMKRGLHGPLHEPRGRPGEKRSGAKNGVPMIVFHGDHDKVVHPLNGERVVEQALLSARAATARDRGHPVARAGRVPEGHAYTCTTYTNRAGQVQVEHWVVQGSGHAWSGGSKAGSFTDPLGPDASAEMLRFFNERRRA
jgi:poly(hydroxyalkanoate) depolymerase family esterase